MKSYQFYAWLLLAITLNISTIAQPVSNSDDDYSKIYVKVYGGYGFLAPGSFKGKSDITITNEATKFHVSKTGMGEGVRAGIGFGVILNEFINLGIDGEYLSGKSINLRANVTSAESFAIGSSGYSLEGSRTYQHAIVSIIPNIVLKAISKPSYYIYNRLGVLVGIPVHMTEVFFQHYHYLNINDATNDPHTLKERDIIVNYNGNHILKPSLGYQFTIGTQFRLSDRLRGFFEVSAYSVSFDRDRYEDASRLRIQVDRNKFEPAQPTVYDHSRYIFKYISSGATGTNVKGVPFNEVTTVSYAQDPVIMNAITAGIGIAYRF